MLLIDMIMSTVDIINTLSLALLSDSLVHECDFLGDALPGLECVVVHVVHLEAVVSQDLVPYFLLAHKTSAACEHVLQSANFHVDQLVATLPLQAKVQLKAAEDRLLVDLHFVQLQLQQLVSESSLKL